MIGAVVWMAIGGMVVFRFMHAHRPCGWWWLALPVFATIWPTFILTTKANEG